MSSFVFLGGVFCIIFIYFGFLIFQPIFFLFFSIFFLQPFSTNIRIKLKPDVVKARIVNSVRRVSPFVGYEIFRDAVGPN